MIQGQEHNGFDQLGTTNQDQFGATLFDGANSTAKLTDGQGSAKGADYQLQPYKPVNHKRFQSLPQVPVKEITQKGSGRKNDAALVTVDSVDTGPQLLQKGSTVWNENFSKAIPMDHIKRNIFKLHQQFGFPDEDRKGAGLYKPPVPYVEQEKQKMAYERNKIKNIIGNNPFRVRNYVQGDDLNNDLTPLKLLKPKEKVFNDDDEFIEHFLEEKRKQEQALLKKKKKKKQDAGFMMLKLGVALSGAITKAKGASSPNGSDKGNASPKSQESKTAGLKSALQKMIAEKKAKQAALELKEKQESSQVESPAPSNKLQDLMQAGLSHEGAQDLLMSPTQDRQPSTTDKNQETEPDETLPPDHEFASNPSQKIFGDFEAEMSNIRRMGRKLSLDAGTARRLRNYGMHNLVNSIRQRQNSLIQNESQQLHTFQHRESSIQQLGHLAPSGPSGVISSGNQSHEQSFQNLNFVPGQGIISNKDMSAQQILPHSQAGFQITQSDGLESSNQQMSSMQQITDNHMLMMDPSNANMSEQGSFLPQQIKGFLQRKQPSPQVKHGQIHESRQNLAVSNFNRMAILHRSPNQQKYESTPQIEQSQTNNKEWRSGKQTDLDNKQDALAAMLKKDFMPGKIANGPSQAVAMRNVNSIISNARKLENQNLSLRELANRMKGKINHDRSPINLQSQPDMFSNLKFFERQFRLKKYEIEDLYLLRREANKEVQKQQQMQMAQYAQHQSDVGGSASMQDSFLSGNAQSIQQLQQTQQIYEQDFSTKSTQVLPGSNNQVQKTQYGSLTLDPIPPAGVQGSKQEETEEHNNDVIHVTLEAASMKQLIKLSQELIPEDQIEAEIEKQSTTFEGQNNTSAPDDGYELEEADEVDGLKDSQVHMVGEEAPLVIEDAHLKSPLQNNAQTEELSTILQRQPAKEQAIKNAAKIDNVEFTGGWQHQTHMTNNQLKEAIMEHPSQQFMPGNIEQISGISIEHSNKHASDVSHTKILQQDNQPQHDSLHDSVLKPQSIQKSTYPSKQSQDPIVVADNTDYHQRLISDKKQTEASKKSKSKRGSGNIGMGLVQAQSKEKFSEVTFLRAEKESRIYQRQLKLGDNLQKYLDEQQRKDKLLHDVELGFRQTSPQQDQNQENKMAQSQTSSEMLLTAANHFILNTRENVIQSKIRSLLVGTELEEIAKSAQIVIHIQEDAKEYLKAKIQEQQEKRKNKNTLMRPPDNDLRHLLNMNGGGSQISNNSSMKSMEGLYNRVQEHGHTVHNQNKMHLNATDKRKINNETVGNLKHDPNKDQSLTRYVKDQKQGGLKAQTDLSQFNDSNFGLQSRFNVDFTAKEGEERVDHFQRGPSGFSGTLFNQNFQQNGDGGKVSPKLMVSNQMQDVMAGIDTDNFTDQQSGKNMRSTLANRKNSDSEDPSDKMGQVKQSSKNTTNKDPSKSKIESNTQEKIIEGSQENLQSQNDNTPERRQTLVKQDTLPMEDNIENGAQ